MSSRSGGSRQMFIVDLVTLLLLVMIVALRISTDTNDGSPGVKEAVSLRFTSTNETTNRGDPAFGVALIGTGIDPIIGKPSGVLDDPKDVEVVQIYSVPQRVHVDVFQSHDEILNNKLKIIIFSRDRGTRNKQSLSVTAEYFDRNAGGGWRTLSYNRPDGDRVGIKHYVDGKLMYGSAIAEISLINLIQSDNDGWLPVGEKD